MSDRQLQAQRQETQARNAQQRAETVRQGAADRQTLADFYTRERAAQQAR